jgi:outer membrane protein assembly factor BamA
MSHFEYNRGRLTVKYYPSAGLDPASGFSLGVLSLVSISPKEKERKKIKFFRPTSISTSASYSTKNWVNLKSDMMIYASHGIVVNTLIQYQISPDKFYGIGNDTLNTSPVKFDMNDLLISGNVSKELTSTVYLGFMFDVSHRDYTSLGANENGLDLPEQKNKTLVGFGPHFTFDRRDNVNYPAHGEYVTFGFKYFAPYNENAYSFYEVELNARKYFTIYKDFILATQLFCGLSEGDIPFYSLYQLGGMTRMRGISNKYIYIDKNAYFAQCELRKHIWNRFGLVLFGGIGNTYEKMSEVKFDQMKYVYGGGIRFQSDTKNIINLRLDYGRGSFGDSGIYMTMREAF